MGKMKAVWRLIRRRALSAGLIAAGLGAGIMLCGVAQDRGFLSAQKAPEIPPPMAQAQPASLPAVPQAAEEDLPSTFTLRRGDLEQVVTAPGTLQSTTRYNVNTSLTKQIASVNAQVGSRVEVGDILCQLDTSVLDREIASVEAGIARAEKSDALKLAQAESKLTQLQQTQAHEAQNLEKDIQAAADALEAAKKQVAQDTANRLAPAEQVTLARETMEAANKLLLETPKPLDGTPNPLYAERLEAANAATIAYDNAQTLYQAAWDNYYQEAYDSAQPYAETTAYERTLAQRETAAFRNQRALAKAQDEVNTCRATDSAARERAILEKKQAERDEATITAPVAGTVTAVGAQVGNTPGERDGDALFTIQSPSSLVLEALVPQADAMNLAINMPAVITAGGLDGLEWSGAISDISGIADDKARFTVTVRLTTDTGRLTVGMEANLRVHIATLRDVFCVPQRAVGQNEDGQAVVYAEAEPGDPPREIPVQTGVESARKVEIEGEGLFEGLVLLTAPPGVGSSGTSLN